jgi:hypothetical protein
MAVSAFSFQEATACSQDVGHGVEAHIEVPAEARNCAGGAYVTSPQPGFFSSFVHLLLTELTLVAGF